MRKTSKLLSWLLIGAVITTFIPNSAYTADIEDTPQQTGTFDSGQPPWNENVSRIIGELPEKRQANIKHFIKEDNTLEAVIYPYPVHYKASGVWKDIDNTLVEQEDAESPGNKVLVNKSNDIRVKIAQNSNASKLVRITKDQYEISWSINSANNSKSVVTPINPAQINEIANAFASGRLASMERSGSADKKQILIENEKKIMQPQTVSKVEFSEVFPSTDLHYIIESNQVKENIILKTKVANPQFSFTLNTKNLTPVLQKDGNIAFTDAADPQKTVLLMARPVMMDAKGDESEDVRVVLETAEKGYKLSIVPDIQWLNAPERAYPVTIDPPVLTPLEIQDISDTYVQENFPNSNSYNLDRLKVGKGSTSGRTRSFLNFELPPLAASDMVIHAALGLALIESYTDTTQINVHKILNDWDPRVVTWANMGSIAYDSKVEDYQMVTGNSGSAFFWNITGMVKEWYSSGKKFGMMLKSADESARIKEFISSDVGSSLVRPRITISYVDNSGLEGYWTYHAQDAGRAGTGYVNDYNGNLVFIHEDVSMSGNRMPVTLRHIFNSNEKDSTIGFGRGWRTNLNQTVTSRTFADGILRYIYTDEDGTKHYFKPNDSGVYKDESGIDLTLTVTSSGTTIKDKQDNQLNFNTSGYLTSIVDRNGNTQVIGYNGSNQIISVKDASGRETKLEYANDLLSKIIDPAGRNISYAYNPNSRLTKIIHPDNNFGEYTYEDSTGNLLTASDYDGYTAGFEYGAGKVQRVTRIREYHKDGTQGNQLQISYGYNTTTFTDVIGGKNIYQFNNDGNTISVRDDQGYAKYFDYQKEANISKNKLISDSKVQRMTMNLLKNHNAEVAGDTWASGGWSGSTGSGSFSTEQKYIGNTALRVEKTNTTARYHFYQPVTVQKGGTYTLSGFVKTSGISNTHGKGALIFVGARDSADNPIYFESEKLSGTADWQRLELTFAVPQDSTTTTVNVAAGITEETGIAYFDALQLEEGPIANRYNLVENADFTQGLAYWTKVGGDADDTVVVQSDAASPKGLDANRMRFIGNAAVDKWLYQEVKVSGKAGDAFVVSGWGKGQSVPLAEPRWFAIDIQYNYTDNTKSWHTFNFNEDSTEWQYAAYKSIAKKDYGSVTVIYRYYRNQNAAYFDGFQLFREEFNRSYQYDNNGNITSTVDLNKNNSTFQYDPATNNLIKAIDPKGGIFRYTYDDKHNLKTAATAENDFYSFQYDSFGNPTQAKLGDLTDKYSDANNWLNGNKFFVMDINGDGKDDLATRDTDGTWSFWKSNNEKLEDLSRLSATGYSDPNGYGDKNRFFVMDFDGDGKEDLVARNSWGGFEIALSDGNKLILNADYVGIPALSDSNGWLGNNRFFVMDINGDHKDDLLTRNSAGEFQPWISTGTDLVSLEKFGLDSYTDASGFDQENRFFVMDSNGDGKDDLVVRYAWGEFRIWLSDGTKLVSSTSVSIPGFSDSNGWNTGNRFLVMDINGDHRDDLVARYSWEEFAIWRSDGTTLAYSTNMVLPGISDANGWLYGNRFLVMDINGDDREDLVARYGGSKIQHRCYLCAGNQWLYIHPGTDHKQQWQHHTLCL